MAFTASQAFDLLRTAFSRNRLPHALLIVGDEHQGASRLILQLLELMNGIRADHLDSVRDEYCRLVRPKSKSRRILRDDIRAVEPFLQQRAAEGKWKIAVFMDAERMNDEAANAFLKTLEEPPAYAVILLLTTNVNALLPTILSRCVVLNMKPVADDLIRKYLMQALHVPDYKAEVCVAFSRGNIGKAKALASSEDFDNVKAEALSLLKYIKDMELTEIISAIKKITEYKFDVGDYLDIFAIWYRDILLFKATNDVNHLVFREEIQAIRTIASRCSYEGLEDIIKALDTAKRRLEANVNFDLTMELLLLTIQDNIAAG